ncbi:MAG: acyltransferase domain-containing protein, partial [Clostridia bacterium]|nr:acyltransferase domain-containing protein [Clostridia bacterium]
MKKDFLRTGRQWIDFKESHWNAILKAFEIVTQNPTLVSLFENDVARTDGELTMPLKEMKESYGAVMAIYPTLPLLAHVPELVERYQEKGIPEEILRDTLSDIPLWIENAERRTGEIALLEYGWLSRYVRMELFRRGRLEFAISENGLEDFAVK